MIAKGALPSQVQSEQEIIQRLEIDWQMFDGYVSWDAQDESPWLKVQDMLVIDLVRSNPKTPIHFASTVGPENFIGLDKYLRMDGMVYTLQKGRTIPVPQDSILNLANTEKLVDSVFKFQGVGDGTTYVNDETQHLLYNYNSIFIRLAMQYRMMLGMAKMKGDTQGAQFALTKGLFYMQKALKHFPDEWRNYVVQAELYQINGDFEKAIEVLSKGRQAVSSWNKEPIEQKIQELDMMKRQGSGIPMQATPQGVPVQAEQ
jgi:hypothetical protein